MRNTKTITVNIYLNRKELHLFEDIMRSISNILMVSPNENKGIFEHAKGVYTAKRWAVLYEKIIFEDEKLNIQLLVKEVEYKKIYSYLSIFAPRKGFSLNSIQ